jgi:hypothetical protein
MAGLCRQVAPGLWPNPSFRIFFETSLFPTLTPDLPIMKKLLTYLLVTIFTASATPIVHAQGAAANPDEADHQALRAIKDALVTAFNQRDYDGFLRYLHPNIVATWQNAEVARHLDGVRAFMKKMSEGDTKRVESATASLTADELTAFYNDKNTGIVFGDLIQDFKFADGTNVHLKSRWTATFVRENGHWLLAAVHVSANIFDNPVLDIALKKTALRVGIGAALAGLVIGLLIGRSRKIKTALPT